MEKKDTKTMELIIVVLVLFSFLYAIKVIGKIEAIDRSIIDIQKLSNSDKPEDIFVAPIGYNKKTENQKESINTNDNNTINTNDLNEINDNSDLNETVKDSNMTTEDPGFWIIDQKQIWETKSILHVFENPIYNFQEKIAPGSSSTYAFNLINNNEYAVKCDIEFVEHDMYGINMKYRLKQNNTYICGDNNTWVTYLELQTTNIVMEPNELIPYILEWKWIDNSNDTDIGLLNNAQYSLSINIYAEEIL